MGGTTGMTGTENSGVPVVRTGPYWYGPVQTGMDRYRPVWTDVDRHGPVWRGKTLWAVFQQSTFSSELQEPSRAKELACVECEIVSSFNLYF
jgi:hypothetical protein